uniref:Uncharacterized protein n=1 Tax=Minutocellus polymorphus TaxID=265543 RepID=A0A7S0AFP4_9STRA|mmetsp:Transcript_12597/g.20980  ORF Transcript_12597/g.20980 Transcript_12597/m.20980 type:complete len:119 (+) Transcript_12597:21-377(+)
MAIVAATFPAMHPLASRRVTGAAVTALLASASVFVASSSPAAFAMSTSSTTTCTVPSALSSHDFRSTSLQPITLGTDPVSSLPIASVGDKLTAKDVLASQIATGGGAGAVAFVVRRPG